MKSKTYLFGPVILIGIIALVVLVGSLKSAKSQTTNPPVYPCIFNIDAVTDGSGNPTGAIDVDLVFITGNNSYSRQITVDGQNWYTVDTLPPHTTWYGGFIIATNAPRYQSVYRFVQQ